MIKGIQIFVNRRKADASLYSELLKEYTCPCIKKRKRKLYIKPTFSNVFKCKLIISSVPASGARARACMRVCVCVCDLM